MKNEGKAQKEPAVKGKESGRVRIATCWSLYSSGLESISVWFTFGGNALVSMI